MNPLWAQGSTTSGPGRAHRGSGVWATALGGNYYPDARTYLHLPPVDLTGSTDASIVFRLWSGVYDSDGASLEVWDGDAWETLEATTPAYDQADGIGAQAWGWQTYHSSYVLAGASLTDYAGQVIRLRFAFRSNGSWNDPGVYLDDLTITDESMDLDGDGLPGGLAEYLAYGTDPLHPDTDGDGIDDGTEIAAATDPLDPTWYPGGPVLTPGTLLTFEADPQGLVPLSVHPGKLTATRLQWEHGTIANGPGVAYSGYHGWATNLDGNFFANAREYLNLPPLDLTATTTPELAFRLWMNGHGTSGDGLSVEIHAGTGWLPLLPVTPAYESLDATSQAAWVQQSDPDDLYVPATVDLTPWSGQQVRVRFVFPSNGSWQNPGAYLDNLELR